MSRWRAERSIERRMARGFARMREMVKRTAAAAGRLALHVLLRVEGIALGAGTALLVWAAADISPTAGKVAAGLGLLFLGGAIARVRREVGGG